MFLILGLFFVSAQPAKAEYRAFVLQLMNEKTKVARQILTTLDPDQYKTQFPLNADESLTYVDTWRCLGRTDAYKPICDKPDKNPGRSPSQSLEKNEK